MKRFLKRADVRDIQLGHKVDRPITCEEILSTFPYYPAGCIPWLSNLNAISAADIESFLWDIMELVFQPFSHLDFHFRKVVITLEGRFRH